VPYVGTYDIRLTVTDRVTGESDTETKLDYITVSTGSVSTNVYVSPEGGHVWPFRSWADASTNLQEALDAATNNYHVILDNGVYKGGSTYAENMTIRSVNGPEVTLIDGEHKEQLLYSKRGITLQGLTFKRSNGTAAGIYSGTSIITNCHFINNRINFTVPFAAKGPALAVGSILNDERM